jgi:hypothetical protein
MFFDWKARDFHMHVPASMTIECLTHPPSGVTASDDPSTFLTYRHRRLICAPAFRYKQPPG